MTLPASTTVEDLPLEQLQEWSRNPRRISKPRLEALKRALVAEPEMLRVAPRRSCSTLWREEAPR